MNSLFIAIPCYANPSAITVQTILGFQQFGNQFSTTIKFLSGSALIDIARSELVGFFVHQTECTHLLFLDADIGFNPARVKDMMACESDVILAAYRMKIEPFAWTVGMLDGSGLDKQKIYSKRGGRFIEIERAGLGCTLISRRTIETLYARNQHLSYRSHDPNIQKNVCHLFSNGIKNDYENIPRAIGEDAAFFHRVLEIGFKVECLIDFEISHGGITDSLGKYLK